MNGGEVFVGPGVVVTPCERRGIAHFDRQPKGTTGSRLELQPGVSRTATGDDRHDRPVAPAKDARQRLFINGTWAGAVPRMGMNPHAREFLRPPTEIDLLVEEFGHRIVREGHCHGRTDLWD